MGREISFYLISLVTILSALGAAFNRSLVKSAYCLFFTLIGMAGLYVLLGSGFLAITQVIIYVGGILVLLMFGILLSNHPQLAAAAPRRSTSILIALTSIVAFLLLTIGIMATQWDTARVGHPRESVSEIGQALLGSYALVFQVAGVLLLLCLIGAAFLVRREN